MTAPNVISFRLSDEEKARLEKYRAKHGLRSLNEAFKHMLALAK